MSGAKQGGGAHPGEPWWHRRLFAETDVSALVFVRIAFGLVMFREVWRFFDHGFIERFWVEPSFNFKYPGFEWVQALPGDGMYCLWAGLGACAACIALGLFYRFATALFFLGYTYSFLLEEARFQNHYYLICLVSFLMILVPANAAFSLDVKLGLRKRQHIVPAWPRMLLIGQMSAVYFFGGIAKINADWLKAEPVRMWLESRGDYPLIGPLLTSEPAAWFVSYWGMLFDLALPFLLLSKRTRACAFALTILFHLSNEMLFSIGIFPVLGIAMTTVFFPADWPRRVFAERRFGAPAKAWRRAWPTGARTLAGRYAVLGLVTAWTGAQVFLPLRHWLYPGNVSWTEEGHKWAWHMKLRDKNGIGHFIVEDATGARGRVDPETILPHWQARKGMTRPDLLLQFAQHIGRGYEKAGLKDVRVYSRVRCSLNGREYQYIVDPEMDLMGREETLAAADWILPLRHDLPGRGGGRKSSIARKD